MYTLWTILAASSDAERIAGRIFGWALFFLFVVYVFKDDDKKEKPKVQDKKVKSLIFLVFFSLVMMVSFVATWQSVFTNRTRSLSGAIVGFTIFYLSAFGVKKMLNFRDLFRKKNPGADTKIGKRDT